jgi:spermidine/putrescine transport system permease protein
MARLRLSSRTGPAISIGIPIAYMMFLFLAPIFVFLVYSFWRLEGFEIIREWTLENYVHVIQNRVYVQLIVRSIGIGAITGVVTVLLSYPVAYAMVFRMKAERELILLLMILSLFSSYLVRVYAWKTILGGNGVINNILMSLGLVQEPLSWLIYSKFAVIITLTSVFLPITVLPLYSSLMNISYSLIEASRDLGAGAAQTFRKVTLPLSMPGVVAGFIFTFVLTAGDYVTPALLGGSDGQLIGNSITSQFGVASNWPLGSAITFFVVATLVILFLLGGMVFKKLGLRG